MSDDSDYPYYDEADGPKALLGGGEAAAYVILRRRDTLSVPHISVGYADQWEEVPMTVAAVRKLAQIVEQWAADGLV